MVGKLIYSLSGWCSVCVSNRCGWWLTNGEPVRIVTLIYSKDKKSSVCFVN